MTVGNAWAWPSRSVPSDQTSGAMLDTLRRLSLQARDLSEYGHPLELGDLLETLAKNSALETVSALGLDERMPSLAVLNILSPLEAALFEAYGKMYGKNVFHLLGKDWVNEDLSRTLGRDFAGEYLDRYVLAQPKKTLPLYHLVGGLDPLTLNEANALKAEGKAPNDGRPFALVDWIAAEGVSRFKIKLAGNDALADLDRTLAVYRTVSDAFAKIENDDFRFSADFNEKCQDEKYLLDWLAAMKEKVPEMIERLEYVEQPTGRDLNATKITMFEAAKKIPVVVDEALDSVQAYRKARTLGYSGAALKACKGLRESLRVAAAAQKDGAFLCVQDLTCPGKSFLQSAALAARIPSVAAVEGNARQYCPAANEPCAKEYPGLFHITTGTVETGVLNGMGLGYDMVK